MNLRGAVRPLLWVGVFSVALGGCTGWKTIPPPYDRSLDALGPPDVARVTTAGSVLVLREPVATADSIIGTDEASGSRRAFSIDAVKAVELKHVDRKATGWAIGLGVLGSATAALVICAATYCYE